MDRETFERQKAFAGEARRALIDKRGQV